MSSYQEYIDHLMEDNGKFKGAAICGVDGSVWAKSPDFEMSVEEVKKLNEGEAKLSQDGVYLAGVKYVVRQHQINDEDNPFIVLKTSGNPDGVHWMGCIYKSKLVFIIGIGAPETEAGEIIRAVRKIFALMNNAGY